MDIYSRQLSPFILFAHCDFVNANATCAGIFAYSYLRLICLAIHPYFVGSRGLHLTLGLWLTPHPDSGPHPLTDRVDCTRALRHICISVG